MKFQNFYFENELHYGVVQDEKLYVQVAYEIESETTFTREVKSLLAVHDAYPKLLLARTHHPEYVHEGIRVLDVEEWLLGE